MRAEPGSHGLGATNAPGAACRAANSAAFSGWVFTAAKDTPPGYNLAMALDRPPVDLPPAPRPDRYPARDPFARAGFLDPGRAAEEWREALAPLPPESPFLQG